VTHQPSQTNFRSTREEPLRTPREERDYRRGYTISIKRLFLAFLIELVIVITSLIAAWLYAEEYSHDLESKIMMMLAPIAYAVVELTRVPLALATRSHLSALMRIVALVAVLGAAGVTVKSMSQLGQMQFQPRLDKVVSARAELREARDNKGTIEDRIKSAQDDVATAKAVLEKAQDHSTAVSGDARGLPPTQCHPVMTTRPDNTVVRSQRCLVDPRTAPMMGNLANANAAVNKAQADLDAAEKRLHELDLSAADRAVTTAEINYRETIHHSQLHSFAGMLFGIDGTDVSDGEINTVLRIFVFGAAIFVSLSSTFLAMTAVVPVKKQASIEIPDAGIIALLQPIYREAKERIAKQAAVNLADHLTNDSIKAAKSEAAKTDEPSPPPEESEVIDLLHKLKERRDADRRHD
jgi:hypothetical protein